MVVMGLSGARQQDCCLVFSHNFECSDIAGQVCPQICAIEGLHKLFSATECGEWIIVDLSSGFIVNESSGATFRGAHF